MANTTVIPVVRNDSRISGYIYPVILWVNSRMYLAINEDEAKAFEAYWNEQAAVKASNPQS